MEDSGKSLLKASPCFDHSDAYIVPGEASDSPFFPGIKHPHKAAGFGTERWLKRVEFQPRGIVHGNRSEHRYPVSRHTGPPSQQSR